MNDPHPLSRRTLLAAGLATATVAAVGCEADDAGEGEAPAGEAPFDPTDFDQGEALAWDPAALAEDPQRFPRAVSSGAMTSGSALLLTFVAPGADAPRLRVWRDASAAGEVILVRDLEAPVDADGFSHVPLESLAPGTRYHYAWLLGPEGAPTARSAIGHVRTAPREGDRPKLRLGASTCTSLANTPYHALELTAEAQPDLFVHLGDVCYQDASRTLEDYRDVWRRTLEDPGYRAILGTCGLYATWDDHEFDDNWDPETFDPARGAIARKTWFESLPVERGPDDRIWRSYRWGSTAEIFVLDCRSERLPSTAETDHAIYMSDAQMAWLKQALADSPCHFKILLNSVPATTMPLPLWGFQNDRWQGYEQQRDELIDHILDAQIRNVWFLSGDFHVGFVARLEATGPRRNLYEIAVGPGANGPNPIVAVVNNGPEDREYAIPAAQFLHFNGGFASTVLDFDPADDSVTVEFRKFDDGEILYSETLRQR